MSSVFNPKNPYHATSVERDEPPLPPSWKHQPTAYHGRAGTVHLPRMANIGERASLKILREKSFGLYLDGGELGEVLLPHREVPKDNVIGGFLNVFIYTDSEDRPVATLKTPKGLVTLNSMGI